MKRASIKILALISFALLLLILVFRSYIYEILAASPGSSIPSTALSRTEEEKQKIKEAIQREIIAQREEALALLLYDTEIENIGISQDGSWAIGWLIPVDPETRQVVSTEPGMAIVRREVETWKAFLPSNSLWALLLRDIPIDLLSKDQKEIWMQIAEIQASALAAGPYGGYHLPWEGYDTMNLTQSVGHDRYTPSGSAHFAFDFAKPGYPSSLFNVYAAKSGIVKRVVWSYPNGDSSNTNYLVLEDNSTSPVTYQLYMHFAQNSIPSELRVVGASVLQGRLIGIADDTGVSSGNHLHFMVHTYPSSYWGTSVDITFLEVSINGGRPRIQSDLAYCRSSDVCETTQTSYVSQNFLNPDGVPPQGGITSPSNGTTVAADMVRLSGYASDDNSGISSVQFIARYNGKWNNVGSPFNTGNFSMDWDLCSSQVPDGPVSLTLVIKDRAGNQAPGLPGLTHFIKNFTCPSPPPTCVPSANQVALFSEKDYGTGMLQPGNCVLLGAGSYTTPSSLGNVGDDNTVSIQVGSNVQATLFMKNNLQGRAETFVANDSNLDDNRIGSKTTSSVLVQTRSTTSAKPTLVWPLADAAIPSDASFTLSWENAGGALQYRARLLQSGNQVLITPWQIQPFVHLSSLASGTYEWQVRAKNNGGESAWSSARSLVIQPPSTPTVPLFTAPYTDTMEIIGTGWTYSNFLLVNDTNHSPGGTYSWKYDLNVLDGYDNGSPNSGYLTSPKISIPVESPYYLRFWYQYETESPQVHWDQRWVQISVDGGIFTNLVQLSDDMTTYWLRSPVISLAAYSGKTIQIRFYFATLDQMLNNFKGWYIDDFTITSTPPPICNGEAAETTPNNDYLHATSISYYAPVNAGICPEGDIDYYMFQGNAGDQICARVDAQILGSPLDSYLSLLDIDGSSSLVENDDQILYQRSDSAVSYKLPRSGTFYLKVRSWDHPNAGSSDHTYTLRLMEDVQNPTGIFTYPTEGTFIPSGVNILRVNASDGLSGVSHVQFFWHSNDWLNSDWIFLGDDWNGQDGWNYPFDASMVPKLTGIAFYANVYDWAGNRFGTGVWNINTSKLFFPIMQKGK